MQDPLKQGLKPAHPEAVEKILNIRMQDPLKQGLKPSWSTTKHFLNTIFECKIH